MYEYAMEKAPLVAGYRCFCSCVGHMGYCGGCTDTGHIANCGKQLGQLHF